MSQPIGTPASTTATSQWKRLISFENRVRMLSIAWGGWSTDSARRHTRRTGLLLVFVQIFAGDIVLRHFVRVNFPSLAGLGGLHAHYYVGLEGVSFLEQFIYTLGTCTFKIGQSLQISRLPARMRYRFLY